MKKANELKFETMNSVGLNREYQRFEEISILENLNLLEKITVTLIISFRIVLKTYFSFFFFFCNSVFFRITQTSIYYLITDLMHCRLFIT